MERELLVTPIQQLSHLLGRISHYQKKNQFVYVRPFESWNRSYNKIAEELMVAELLSLPLFRLRDRDFSPTGKSIRPETVGKLVKTIRQQVSRLEEKLAETDRAAMEELNTPHPLSRFFLEKRDWNRRSAEDLVAVAIPADGDQVFAQGVQPVLGELDLKPVSLPPATRTGENFASRCHDLFRCRLLIVDLTAPAPEAMLLLGLAYGFGKPVVLLRRQGSCGAELPGDVDLKYRDLPDLRSKLNAALVSLLKSI